MKMPSEKEYRALLSAWALSSSEFDAAGRSIVKRRASILRMFHAFDRYFGADDDVTAVGLLRPLSAISREIESIHDGAGSALLRSPRKRGSSKPRAHVQAYMAFAAELLSKAKMGELEAAKWVATEAKRQGVCDEAGGAFTADQVKGWRKEIARKAGAKGAREVFDDLRSDYIGLLAGPSNEGEREINLRIAKAVATALIRFVALTLPLSAPKARGRKN